MVEERKNTMNEELIGEILMPGDHEEQDRSARRIRDSFWQTARRAAVQIPFMEDVVAAYYCAMDPETPIKVRGTLLAALAYFVMPLDTIPDILTLIGFSDDLAVLTAAIAMVRSHITPAHRNAARQSLSLEDGKEADS